MIQTTSFTSEALNTFGSFREALYHAAVPTFDADDTVTVEEYSVAQLREAEEHIESVWEGHDQSGVTVVWPTPRFGKLHRAGLPVEVELRYQTSLLTIVCIAVCEGPYRDPSAGEVRLEGIEAIIDGSVEVTGKYRRESYARVLRTYAEEIDRYNDGSKGSCLAGMEQIRQQWDHGELPRDYTKLIRQKADELGRPYRVEMHYCTSEQEEVVYMTEQGLCEWATGSVYRGDSVEDYQNIPSFESAPEVLKAADRHPNKPGVWILDITQMGCRPSSAYISVA